MAAVFIEGIIFFLLAVTGFRVKFAQMIPQRYVYEGTQALLIEILPG